MDQKEKPAVLTKIVAGGIAGVSETMVTVSIKSNLPFCAIQIK
jgi:hypothetical protein